MLVSADAPLPRLRYQVLKSQLPLNYQLGNLRTELCLSLFIDSHRLYDIAQLEAFSDILPDHICGPRWLCFLSRLSTHEFQKTVVDWSTCLCHEVPVLELFGHWWDRDFRAFHFSFDALAHPVDYFW